ncbi:MAG TPA: L-fuconate dehydratase [Candidatus Limnocylindria bacterium]|jgi:L-fuconate dehydratase|nr:L-fuconate dehydratase [Candidatus Limnocylindria bacterium]
MATQFTSLEIIDLRYPTSRDLDGSDAMNPDPDYSAAYVVLHTSTPGLEGHGLTFTIGRGNELVCAAIRAHEHLLLGQTLETFAAHPGAFWRRLTNDSQLRWIGPEKGVVHLALAAIVNALWDLHAKSVDKPLWRLLADFSPQQVVDCVDFRYLTDALTPDEALAMLQEKEPGKADRIAELIRDGYPAYTTSAGWLGYPDDKIRRLCREAIAEGWNHIKVKVGRNRADDRRRCAIIREEIGWDRFLMVDANQVWDVPQAIDWMKDLAEFRPWWIEEPTSPDDILGHAAIARAMEPLGIGVATGEHGMNRVLFKQLLQARAISFCQIDSCRLGGVNENIAVILLAAKFGVPVCPHAGGVGLCELVQHLSFFDYASVSASQKNRVTEFVDHLHEHFTDPCVVRNGRYVAPNKPGYSTEIFAKSRADYHFPHGSIWKAIQS